MSVGPSLQAVLAWAWDEPTARQQALAIVLEALHAVDHWLTTQPAPGAGAPEVAARVAVAHQVRAHAVILTPDGRPTLRQGGAADRRLSVAAGALRHGRKSRRLLIDGYKRQGLRALDSGLLVAVGVPPATVPEASVTEAIATELAAQPRILPEWHIDRASLASPLGPQRSKEVALCCKAWPVPQGPYFPKRAFQLDWERRELQCPGGVVMPCEPGGVVTLPATLWAGCALWERCTSSPAGRSISIHPDEALWAEWRERQQTPQGRAKLRERVAVAHALAHMGQWQGRRARYRGGRKNVFDLRRCAVVHHVHVLAHLAEPEG